MSWKSDGIGRVFEELNGERTLVAECDLPEHAALVSASPDLLAAVRELMDQPTMNPLDMTPGQRAKLWAAHANARAAIEKAAPFSAWQTGERVKIYE